MGDLQETVSVLTIMAVGSGLVHTCEVWVLRNGLVEARSSKVTKDFEVVIR